MIKYTNVKGNSSILLGKKKKRIYDPRIEKDFLIMTKKNKY